MAPVSRSKPEGIAGYLGPALLIALLAGIVLFRFIGDEGSLTSRGATASDDTSAVSPR